MSKLKLNCIVRPDCSFHLAKDGVEILIKNHTPKIVKVYNTKKGISTRLVKIR